MGTLWNNFVPDLPLLLFKQREIWSINYQQNLLSVATGCQILMQKCAILDFVYGSAINTTGGAYSTSQILAAFQWLTSRGKKGRE